MKDNEAILDVDNINGNLEISDGIMIDMKESADTNYNGENDAEGLSSTAIYGIVIAVCVIIGIVLGIIFGKRAANK